MRILLKPSIEELLATIGFWSILLYSYKCMSCGGMPLRNISDPYCKPGTLYKNKIVAFRIGFWGTLYYTYKEEPPK